MYRARITCGRIIHAKVMSLQSAGLQLYIARLHANHSKDYNTYYFLALCHFNASILAIVESGKMSMP